jgi:hypothetical protein
MRSLLVRVAVLRTEMSVSRMTAPVDWAMEMTGIQNEPHVISPEQDA